MLSCPAHIQRLFFSKGKLNSLDEDLAWTDRSGRRGFPARAGDNHVAAIWGGIFFAPRRVRLAVHEGGGRMEMVGCKV